MKRKRIQKLPELQVFDSDCGGLLIDNPQPIKVRPMRNTYDALRERANFDPVALNKFLAYTGII